MKQRSICVLSFWLVCIAAMACKSGATGNQDEANDDASDAAANGGQGGLAQAGRGGSTQEGGTGGNMAIDNAGGRAGIGGNRPGGSGGAGTAGNGGTGGRSAVGGGAGGQAPVVTIKIQPLGDSITQGTRSEDDYTYRRPLWKKLQQAGHKVDFVGSTNKQFPDQNHLFDDYDHYHEGHWGNTLTGVLSILEERMKGYAPDVSLVHLGTNDQRNMNGQGTFSDSAKMLIDMEKIINVLRARNARITIILSQLILPEAEGRKFNDALPAFAQRLSTAQSRIVVVNQEEGFTENDTFDGIHPNGMGAEKIATKFFTALEEILP